MVEIEIVRLDSKDPVLPRSFAELVSRTASNIAITGKVDCVNECLSFLPHFSPLGTAVHPIFGLHVGSLEDLCYQLSRTIPREYVIRPTIHALYDLALGFETEPPSRLFIWHDAHHYLGIDSSNFQEVATVLVIAAISNSLGLGTVLEDGRPYQVDQRCIFGFDLRVIDSSAIAELLQATMELVRTQGPEWLASDQVALLRNHFLIVEIE